MAAAHPPQMILVGRNVPNACVRHTGRPHSAQAIPGDLPSHPGALQVAATLAAAFMPTVVSICRRLAPRADCGGGLGGADMG